MSEDPAMRGNADKEEPSSEQPIGRSSVPTDALIIVPVQGTVIFPGMVFPIALTSDHAIKAAQQALREQRPIGILMQRDAERGEPSAVDLHRVGTVANVLRYVNAPDGAHHVILQGEQRFRVADFTQEQPFFAAHVVRIEEPDLLVTPEIEARTIHLRRQAVGDARSRRTGGA